MIEIRRILCPIDFSDDSRRALDHALAIGRWYGATVTVLHVYAPALFAAFGAGAVVMDPNGMMPFDRERLLADTRAFAAGEAASGVTVETEIREGDVATEILARAETMHPDLVVIGTHGRSGFERVILGSVAEKVLRKSSAPVLTVPRRLPDVMPFGPVLYRRILCPVDFSDCARHALTYAISLAELTGARLTVQHVVAYEFERASELAAVMDEGGKTLKDFVEEHEAALRQQLAEAVGRAGGRCDVDSVMTHGKPWREILREAVDRQSDLIVMGVHGRGPVDRLVFGSTTQHIVRGASCPVLTLRHA